MKRLNGFIFPVIFIFILILALSSCSSKNANNLILGKWTLGEEFSPAGYRFPQTMEFFSDGSINIQADTGGTYTIDGDRIQIYYAAMDSYTYTFAIEDDMLKMTSTEAPDYGEYIYYRDSAGEDSDELSDTDSSSDISTLAAECDYILAEGTSTSGDKFELVVNESQSYDSAQSVGLIKNGKWLIEMTDNSPIIDDNGSVYYFSYFKNDYEKYISPDWNDNTYPTTYKMVTNDCFLLNGTILWNFETGKTYITNYYEQFMLNEDKVTNENKILISEESDELYNSKRTYKILNTTDMSVFKEFEEGYFYSVGVFSEDLFYAIAQNRDLDGDGYNDKTAGFYDEKGNLIIDLSKYNVTKGGAFSDGRATITAENDTGKEFEITIDKQGRQRQSNPNTVLNG